MSDQHTPLNPIVSDMLSRQKHLARHAAPVPGYFTDFSGRVLTRLHSENELSWGLVMMRFRTERAALNATQGTLWAAAASLAVLGLLTCFLCLSLQKDYASYALSFKEKSVDRDLYVALSSGDSSHPEEAVSLWHFAAGISAAELPDEEDMASVGLPDDPITEERLFDDFNRRLNSDSNDFLLLSPEEVNQLLNLL